MNSQMRRSVSPKLPGLNRGYVFTNALTGLLRYHGPAHLEGRTGFGSRLGFEPTADCIDLPHQLDVNPTGAETFRLAHGKAPRGGAGQGCYDKTRVERICLLAFELCQFSYQKSRHAATVRDMAEA